MGHCLASVSEANEIQQTDSEQHLDSAPVDQVHLRTPLSESLIEHWKDPFLKLISHDLSQ